MSTVYRKRGQGLRRTAVTLTDQDKERLESIRQNMKDGQGRVPSRCMALSEAIRRMAWEMGA